MPSSVNSSKSYKQAYWKEVERVLLSQYAAQPSSASQAIRQFRARFPQQVQTTLYNSEPKDIAADIARDELASGNLEANGLRKAEIFDTIAKETGHTKAEVEKFFAALEGLVVRQLGKKGTGVFKLPGLVELRAVKKPASKGGETRPNPFRPGEFIVTKPKAVRVKVRARPLRTFTEALS